MGALKLERDRSTGRSAMFALIVAAAAGGALMLGDRPADPKVEFGFDAAGPGAARLEFKSHQANTQWRAPRLVGVDVFDLDGRKVGKVEDLLMNHDGVVQTVVIGVGGILGFGAKHVAVPFAAMRWRMDPHPGGPGDTLVAARDPSPGGASRAACVATPEAAQGRPDVVGVTATLKELQSAPAFAYASLQNGPDNPLYVASPYQ
jgi:sporulation protein YlmC with PRC-barrel domain